MQTDTSTGAGVDMRQFHAVFFEEADEHLAAMESLLVDIDITDPGEDVLNAVFRAAHSIKGGAGMFGFGDVSELTHEAETLLDRVRKGELALSSAIVDALLESGDVLKVQLAVHKGEDAAAPDVTDLVVRLRRLCAGEPAQADLEARFEAIVPGAIGAVAAAPAYGLFDAEPAEAAGAGRQPGPEVAYGLFEASPGLQSPAAPGPADEPDGAYGLFAASDPVDAGAGAAASGAPPAGVPAARAQPGVSPPAAVPPKARAAKVAEASSIRVAVEKVDQLINLVGELVITQSMLAQNATQIEAARHQQLLARMADLERNTRDLQESVMSIRMMPIAMVFNRFPRMLRDLAAKLGKQVELKMVGEGTELDKGLIEKITDPMTHLVRNSLDHGIEQPAARRAAGKSEVGVITLSASQRGGNIVIEVADDGAGLRRDRILDKARERGIAVPDSPTDSEVWNLIFEPGFSTAEVVTDVSGRGVGMDVVRRNIGALGGSVEIDSATGLGTRMTVRLPLTLAIMDGMSVAIGGEVYILPLASVVESLQADARALRPVASQGRVLDVRGEYLPVIRLADVFPPAVPAPVCATEMIVIVETDGVKAALVVDELVGQHQVVVKSLETNFRRQPGIAGATIMGDGRVALILDVAALIKKTRH